MKSKIGKKAPKWLGRYLPAEIFVIIGAVLGGTVINLLFHNPVFTALGGTWGENTGYYGQILFQDQLFTEFSLKFYLVKLYFLSLRSGKA